MPSVNGEDEPMARHIGVKAAKAKGKRLVGEEGKNLEAFQQMWDLKAKDLALKDKLSKTKLLDSFLAKKEPLSELEVALKNKLITEMLSILCILLFVHGISLHTVSELSPPQPTPKNERVSCSSTKFSLDGSKFMAMKSDGTISIYDSASLGEVRSFAVANVTAAEISPCGTYLQTFQKPTTPQEKNVSLWNTETGDLAHGLYQKSITKTTW
ncbi:hypothetical protein F2Q68_00001040 [Brassica cretica]|uniref:Uncharacterized protein n=2 Tax=Brassica cretica TaxID=69181 RepID=A0A3N6RNN9_BRACR|nr:hypothetical protein F2Q68_00001040 [Brassica cretica]KAF3551403.1 hypothetical protein DY000_02001369 [Brassica cretica]